MAVDLNGNIISDSGVKTGNQVDLKTGAVSPATPVTPAGVNNTNGTADVRLPTTSGGSDVIAPPGYYSRLPADSTSVNGSAARSTLYDVKPVDEATIREQKIKDQEGLLNETNKIYDNKVKEEQVAGEKDLARTNALSAITGMSGSPVATTGQGRADERTRQRVSNVNDLRGLEIAKIYGKIDENVQREKELQLSTNRENSARVLDEMQKNASANIIGHASAGVDWNTAWTASPEFQDEVRRSGADPIALKKEYDLAYASSKNNPDIKDYKTSVENGNLIATWYDSKTGKPGYVVTPLNLPKDMNAKNVETGYNKDTGEIWYFDKNTLKGGSQKVGAPSPSGEGSLTPGQIQSSITSIVGQFDNEPVVKNYNVVKEGYNFANTIGNNKTNPTSSDDQGLIYAFAKAMDPNSAVREGEYQTVQTYAQSMIQSGIANAERFAQNKAFLTPEARKNMLDTIKSKYTVAEDAYKNARKSYEKKIEDAKTGKISGSLVDYGGANFETPATITPKQGDTVDSNDATGLVEGQTGNGGAMIVRGGKWVANK